MTTVKQPVLNQDIEIAVLDRGFVFVGRITRVPEEDCFYIEDAMNIRQWGTERGLGQLRNGPTKETVLDPSGTIRVPNRALLFTVDTDPLAWADKLVQM